MFKFIRIHYILTLFTRKGTRVFFGRNDLFMFFFIVLGVGEGLGVGGLIFLLIYNIGLAVFLLLVIYSGPLYWICLWLMKIIN